MCVQLPAGKKFGNMSFHSCEEGFPLGFVIEAFVPRGISQTLEIEVFGSQEFSVSP